jgi:hypothetical protein
MKLRDIPRIFRKGTISENQYPPAKYIPLHGLIFFQKYTLLLCIFRAVETFKYIYKKYANYMCTFVDGHRM